MKRRLALLLGVVLAAAVAGNPLQAQGGIEASGMIQAREVVVASEFAGRVRAVEAAEGDSVAAGAALVVLDDQVFQDNLAQAAAAVASAEAELAGLKAAPRPEDIAVAQAQVDQARAALAAAQGALRDAAAIRLAPQDLAVQIVAARAQAAAATQAVDAARSELDRATFRRDRESYNSTPWHAADFRRQAAAAGVAAAQADLAAAQAQLQGLEAIRARPLSLLAAEHRAASATQTAAAALKVAEARLADLLAGAQPEEVALAVARLRLAQAQATALQHQADRLTLRAPVEGVVLARLVQPGETALVGAPLMRVGDLRRVDLVVYVPEPRIGEVALGQAVQVRVDSYPGRTFAGRVTHIADRAEYTPRNVATREERVNTYYGVKVTLPNPDGALKAGMPADAVFAPR